MVTHITQSFMKSVRKYKAGQECGNVLQKMFVDMQSVDNGSDVMKVGVYFEFLITSSFGKAGVIPEAEYTKTALDKKPKHLLTVADMTQPYRRAHFNAQVVIRLIKDLGLEFVKYNWEVTKGRHKGTIDIVVRFTRDIAFGDRVYKAGDMIVIDLKLSGLIHDRWEEFGWAFSDIQKINHGTQAIEYHWLTDLDFYFWVTSSTNKEVPGASERAGKVEFEMPEIAIFRVDVTERQTKVHLEEASDLMEQFKVYVQIGLKPRPEYNRCMECPLKADCKDKHTYPHPIAIDLTRI